MVHVGIGYDVHALVQGRSLVLGGVEIPHSTGLDGHSDADVLMHAICDAILGALGKPDIGHYFPIRTRAGGEHPAASFLRKPPELFEPPVERFGINATLIAQQPKVNPHVAQMKANIAAALGVRPDQVGIKATTNELLGFIGREEGIAAMAVASINLPRADQTTLS